MTKPSEPIGQEGTAGNSSHKKVANCLDIYWLGIGILLGGQTINWNHGKGIVVLYLLELALTPVPLCLGSSGMEQGFWQFFVASIVAGSAYLCVALCAAEMASMLPFAGGAYGYVRCALGPTVGYMVGCSESIKYILFVASTVEDLAHVIDTLGNVSQHYHPLLWFIFYAFSLPLLIYGGRPFWQVCMALAAITAILLVIYCLEAIPYGNLARHATGFSSGIMFLKHFAFSTWFFNGIDAVTLTCSDVQQATKAIPKALVGTIATAIAMSICLMLAVPSLPPGSEELVHEKHPLSPGFQQILGVPVSMTPNLAIPGILANAFGFSFAASRQIRSMAGSGLFPKFLLISYDGNGSDTPIAALLFGALMVCLVLALTWALLAGFQDELFHMCLFSSCVVYIALLRAYMVFCGRYSNMERQFVSPLGIAGAYYGMAIFALLFVCVAFFVDTDYWTFMKFSTTMCGVYIYYLLVAKRTEFFSQEEQKHFMKAYVLNANRDRKKGAKGSGKSSKKSAKGMMNAVLSVIKGDGGKTANAAASISGASSPNRAASGKGSDADDLAMKLDMMLAKVTGASTAAPASPMSKRLVHNHMLAVYPGGLETLGASVDSDGATHAPVKSSISRVLNGDPSAGTLNQYQLLIPAFDECRLPEST